MLRKEYIVVLLAVLLSFGLAGTVFAADSDMISANDVSTEAGDFQYHATTQVPGNLNYDQKALSRVGTEAGNWQFNFDAPESKADMAANRYDYNAKSLSAIGTEAGDSQLDARGDVKTMCGTC